MFRLIVSGCRNFRDYEFIANKLDFYTQMKHKDEILVLHGNCNGVDILAEKWALKRKIKYKAYTADWDNFCLLYTSPSPRDRQKSRMPSSA